ncbi:hypothetical protein KUO12_11750 [Vibrio vulnificus]|nr:hypothetical protein [Vibrio vulnificus]HAS6231977.1 hypothetical protein [Vibrio vulnificus]
MLTKESQRYYNETVVNKRKAKDLKCMIIGTAWSRNIKVSFTDGSPCKIIEPDRLIGIIAVNEVVILDGMKFIIVTKKERKNLMTKILLASVE